MLLEEEPSILHLDKAQAIKGLTQDYDNIAAAMEWAAAGDPKPFITMAAALGPFWVGAGFAAEGRRWLGLAVERIENDLQILEKKQILDRIAQTYLFDGFLAFVQGMSSAASIGLEKAAALAAEADQKIIWSFALSMVAPVYFSLGRADEAAAAARKGLDIARESRNDVAVAVR